MGYICGLVYSTEQDSRKKDGKAGVLRAATVRGSQLRAMKPGQREFREEKETRGRTRPDHPVDNCCYMLP